MINNIYFRVLQIVNLKILKIYKYCNDSTLILKNFTKFEVNFYNQQLMKHITTIFFIYLWRHSSIVWN